MPTTTRPNLGVVFSRSSRISPASFTDVVVLGADRVLNHLSVVRIG